MTDATARFAGVLPGVSASYTATARGVKEVVKLGSGAERVLEYDLRGPELWSASLEGDDVVLKDSAGSVRFRVSAPLAWDSAADPAYTNALALSVSKVAAGRWALTLTPDDAWINDPARVWPVSIDPDVTWEDGTTSIQGTAADTYVASGGQANYTYTHNGFVHTGYYNRWYKSLVKFDLSSIPSDATVTGSELKVFQPPKPTQAQRNHRLRAITSSWDPAEVTWNRRDDDTTWTTPGGDVSTDPAMISDPTAVKDTGWYTFTAPTAAVQAWIDGTVPNHGFQLAADTSPAPTNAYTFATNEASPTSTYPATSAERPILEVTWEGGEDTQSPEPPDYVLFNYLDQTNEGSVFVDFYDGEDPGENASGTAYSEARVKINDGAFSAWTTVTPPLEIEGLEEEDTIELDLRSVDNAGNYSSVANYIHTAHRDLTSKAFDDLATAYLMEEDGLTEAQASQWIDVQAEGDDIADGFERTYADSDDYSGHWYDNQTRKVHYQARGDVADQIEDYFQNRGFAAHVVVDRVAHTEPELEAVAGAAEDELETAVDDALINVGLDPVSSEIVFEALEPAAPTLLADIATVAAGLEVPSRVELVPAVEPEPYACVPADTTGPELDPVGARCDPPIRGGVRIGLSAGGPPLYCTSGFNARSRTLNANGRYDYYVLTAGHCAIRGSTTATKAGLGISGDSGDDRDFGSDIEHAYSRLRSKGVRHRDVAAIKVTNRLGRGIPNWIYVQSSETTPPAPVPPPSTPPTPIVLPGAGAFKIVGSRSARPGQIVCVSARVSGSSCGRTIGKKGETVGGTKWSFKVGASVRVKGCSPRRGDSGGPYFRTSGAGRGLAVGTVQGGLADCVGTMQDLRSTLKLFELDLVTTGTSQGAGTTGSAGAFSGHAGRSDCKDRPGYWWDASYRACIG